MRSRLFVLNFPRARPRLVCTRRSRGRRSLLRGRTLVARDHHRLARGAEVLRPGPRVHVRLQPRRGDPLVPARGRAGPGLRDGALGHRTRQRPAHQQSGAAARPRQGRLGSARAGTGRGRGREPGREGADRGARGALRRSRRRRTASRSTRPTRTRCARLGGLSQGRRRRRALRRGHDGPAAVGPLAARRQAAAGDRGADRRARCRAHARAGASARSPSLHPRGRGPGAGAGRHGGRRAARAAARPRPPRPHAVPHRRPPRALAGGDRRQHQGDRRRQALHGALGRAGLLPPLHGPQPPHADLRGHDAGPERARGPEDPRDGE